jgi:hypothetical protein
MDSLIEMLFLHRMSKGNLLERTKIARGGYIELIPKNLFNIFSTTAR